MRKPFITFEIVTREGVGTIDNPLRELFANQKADRLVKGSDAGYWKTINGLRKAAFRLSQNRGNVATHIREYTTDTGNRYIPITEFFSTH